MELRTKTDRTPGAIREAIETMMKNNPRKRVFVAVAECLGNEVITAPESEYPDYDANFHGFIGIQRYCWFTVPGYADRLSEKLAGLMRGEKIAN